MTITLTETAPPALKTEVATGPVTATSVSLAPDAPDFTKFDFPPPARPWQSIRDEKRAEQLSRIPQEWRLDASKLPSPDTVDLRPLAASSGILTERELEITGDNYDATSLSAAIAEGKFTATETVTAFCKRAAICQQLCSALTEIRFADAIEEAKKLDEHFAKTGKTVGPLHGLPMTFKECFHVKGLDYSNGYINRCFNKSTTTTPVIQIAQNAGAIIIAKTNVPQTMLVGECANNVFGHTKNPIVSHLSCGGSSGGEGALSAFHGNALGVGTDVGGSIRLPATFNGIYGYKPSVGVLPFIGYAASGWTGVNVGIPAVCGPIGRSVRDLQLFTKTVRATKPWTIDPAVLPGVMELPLRDSTKKPVVGILHESGVRPHPPIRRAIREAASRLEKAGYDVRDFTPTCPDFKEIRDVATELLTADGLTYQRRELIRAGEPVDPTVSGFGYWDIPRKTFEQHWQWGTHKGALQKAMLDAWEAAGIDILIAPPSPHTPVKSEHPTSEIYTVAWNTMEYPAVIIPYTKVDPKLDPKDSEPYTPKNALDAGIQKLYDPELMAGSPVALQLVAQRLNDAALLKYAEEIDKVLHA